MARQLVKSRLVLIVVAVWGLSACAQPAAPTYFRYQASMPQNKLTYSIVTAADPYFHRVEDEAITGHLVFGGDAVRYYRGCPEEPAYTCIIEWNFVFVVPKNFDAENRTWTVQGITFSIEQVDMSIELLGRKIEGLYLVKASSSGTALGKSENIGFEYLYSPKVGLVAFGHEISYELDYNPLTFWLMDDVGFGAVR